MVKNPGTKVRPHRLRPLAGPRLLRVAGTVADGTILWMGNARAIESHVAPRITTQPPSNEQTAVAIHALEGAMKLEEKQGGELVIA